MSAQEKTYQDMVDGTPWGTITKTHSKSSIYSAYTKFVATIEKNLELLRRDCINLQTDKDELAKAVTMLRKEKDKAISDREKTQQKTVTASERLAEVKEELAHTSNKLEKINSELAQLSEKNISEDLISSLTAMDIVDDKDLLARITKADQVTLLIDEVMRTESKLGQLKRQEQVYQREIQRESEELKSVSNQTAIAKSQQSLIIDAVDVTQKALRRYPKKDIIQLFKEIERIEVRGEPKTTLTYLLNRLDMVKQDLELETRVASLKNEVKILDNEVASVKGVFNAYRNGVTKPIQEAHDIFQRLIQEETQSAKNAIGKVQSETETILNSLAHGSSSAIEKAQKQSEKCLNRVENGVCQRLFNISLVLEARISTCIDETDKWGKVKEEAGQYSYYLSQAILLFGPLVKPESILSLDSWVIKQITKRLHLYAQKKLAGVKTRFPKSIASKEWAISELYDVQLTNLTEALALIMEGLLKE